MKATALVRVGTGDRIFHQHCPAAYGIIGTATVETGLEPFHIKCKPKLTFVGGTLFSRNFMSMASGEGAALRYGVS